jgi:hypothetical protein
MIKITQKDIDAIEASFQYHSQNIEEGLSEQLKFIDILLLLQTELIQSKIEIPEYKNRISSLASKTMLNCNSIINLLKGQTIDSEYLHKKFELIDIPSLYTLLRAQIENFLMFDFIYCQPKSEEEIIFRYYNWIYSGLLSRNDFFPSTDNAKRKKKEDENDIVKFRKIITESKYFNEFTPNQKRRLLEPGDPRLFLSWNDLFDRAKIHKDHSRKTYRLISAHAHTTGLSIINLDSTQFRYSKTHASGHLVMFMSKLFLCKFIIRFKERFKVTEIAYNTLPIKSLNKIEFYSKVLNTKYTIGA